MLAYLDRAKGDLNAALEAAQRSAEQDLVDHLLIEKGAWKQLAERGANSLTSRGFRPNMSPRGKVVWQ